MKRNKGIIDTNILVRFFTRDNLEQIGKIRSLFKTALPASLYIPNVVILETSFVLLRVYKVEKEELIEKLKVLLHFEKFKVNTRLFELTLELYSKYSISLLDAYLGALTQKEDVDLYTFDKNLLKIKEIKAVAPKKQRE